MGVHFQHSSHAEGFPIGNMHTSSHHNEHWSEAVCNSEEPLHFDHPHGSNFRKAIALQHQQRVEEAHISGEGPQAGNECRTWQRAVRIQNREGENVPGHPPQQLLINLTKAQYPPTLGTGLSPKSLGSFPKLKVLSWFSFLRSIFNDIVWGYLYMFVCVCRDQRNTLGPPELGVTAGYESPHMGAGSQALILCKCAKCFEPHCHFFSLAYSQ